MLPGNPGTRVVLIKNNRFPGYSKFEYFGHTSCICIDEGTINLLKTKQTIMCKYFIDKAEFYNNYEM